MNLPVSRLEFQRGLQQGCRPENRHLNRVIVLLEYLQASHRLDLLECQRLAQVVFQALNPVFSPLPSLVPDLPVFLPVSLQSLPVTYHLDNRVAHRAVYPASSQLLYPRVILQGVQVQFLLFTRLVLRPGFPQLYRVEIRVQVQVLILPVNLQVSPHVAQLDSHRKFRLEFLLVVHHFNQRLFHQRLRLVNHRRFQQICPQHSPPQNLLDSLLNSQLLSQPHVLLPIQVDSRLSNHLENPVGNHLSSHLDNRVASRVESQPDSQLRNRLIDPLVNRQSSRRHNHPSSHPVNRLVSLPANRRTNRRANPRASLRNYLAIRIFILVSVVARTLALHWIHLAGAQPSFVVFMTLQSAANQQYLPTIAYRTAFRIALIFFAKPSQH